MYGDDNPYMTIAEVAELIRKTPNRVRNMMYSGVFRESVHYFRPRGLTPLFKRDAVIQWVEGREPAQPEIKRRKGGPCRVDLSLIPPR